VVSFRKSFLVRPLQLVLLLVLLLATGHVRAADKIAVISLKPSEQILADVDYLLSAAGLQELGQFVGPQVRTYLQGVNGKLPIGVVVTIEQSEFIPLGFVPVTNLNTFLAQLRDQVGEPTDAGEGILELQGPQPLFVKEQAGWAFFGQTKDALNQLPDDPAKLLEGLETQYDVGIRAYVKNVPEPFKQLAIGQLKEGLQRGMANNDDAAARQMAEAQVAQLTQLAQEADTVTIGWQIDAKQRRTHLDLALSAVPGSQMAKQIDASRNAKTSYGGFLRQDAAIRANVASVLLQQQIDEAVLNLDRFEKQTLAQIDNDGDLDDRTRTAAKQLLQTFFTIARSTFKSGKFDSCTSVVLNPKTITLISASHVASGSEVDQAVKQLVELAKNESEFSFSSVKLNAAEHAGVKFHTLAIAIPEEEFLRKVLGDTLDIAIGVADNSAYLALGSDSLDQLKKSIDASGRAQQSAAPFNLDISLLPILKFAQSVEANPIIDGIVQLVGSASGKDHIRAHASVDDKGLLYRFEVEEGVLKVLGQAGQLVGVGAL
jgi:hypothetical protein